MPRPLVIRVGRVGRAAAAVTAWGAGVAVAAWLAGRIVSDTWVWSQWLLWIPTPAAVAAAAVGLVATACRAPGRRLAAWGVVLAAMAGWFAFVEHRFHRWPPTSESGVTLVHWNIAHHQDAAPMRYVETLDDLDADVYVLTNAADVGLDEHWAGQGRIIFVRPFTVITRLPVLEIRPLIASGGMHVTLLVVDAQPERVEPITIWMVDMPSDPNAPRMENARTLRAWLDESPPPPADLVMGDLNTTRGSRALRHAWPGFVNAFDLAGRGYGATYPSGGPLWHIDHVLVDPTVLVGAYEIIDPGYGRHRLQRVRVRW